MVVNSSDTVDAQSVDGSRTIEETDVVPGGSTVVEVSVTDEDELPLREIVEITEAFSPAFDDVTVDDISPVSGSGGPGPDSEELLAVWNENADTYTVSYEVTLPPDATGDDEFEISGTVDVAGEQESLPTSTITVDLDVTAIELRPAETSVDPGAGTTVDVVAVGAGNGVASYDITVSTSDAAVAELTAVSLAGSPDTDTSSVAGDGSSATVAADMGGNAYEGADEIVLAELTVDTPGEGTASLAVDDGASVTDTTDAGYDFDFLGEAMLTVSAAPSLADYANEDGIVNTDGLRAAISDWRAGDIDTGLLRSIIDAWRSGDPVA